MTPALLHEVESGTLVARCGSPSCAAGVAIAAPSLAVVLDVLRDLGWRPGVAEGGLLVCRRCSR